MEFNRNDASLTEDEHITFSPFSVAVLSNTGNAPVVFVSKSDIAVLPFRKISAVTRFSLEILGGKL